ncbi:MAG: sigma-70 family RNA polymerase sigma factor [Clostridia bacterium]|nr:sigma-70 family RNA polymerase sigma factor [Clostridia bacterium]
MDARETLDDLMVQHGSRLLRLCAMNLRDASLAQDAVQDTFLKAFRQFHRFRGDADALTWLTAIAINVCRDYRRTAWFRHVDRRMEDLPEQAANFPFPDNTVITEVTKLPDKYREVILLRYYQDMKQKDIAAALGISDRAVRQRLNKANTMLREQLKEWYEDEG